MAQEPPAQGISRRALLRSGLAGIALVTVGGIGVALQPSKLRPVPRGGLRVLSPKEYATLAAMAERLCPPEAPNLPGPSEIDVAGLADALFATAEDDVKKGIKLGLQIVESGLVGALFLERAQPFTQLASAQQDRVLLLMRDSKVGVRRTLFRVFSSLTGSIYYGDPRTWAAIGYPGPPDPAALRAAYSENLVDWNALRPARAQGGG